MRPYPPSQGHSEMASWAHDAGGCFCLGSGHMAVFRRPRYDSPGRAPNRAPAGNSSRYVYLCTSIMAEKGRVPVPDAPRTCVL